MIRYALCLMAGFLIAEAPIASLCDVTREDSVSTRKLGPLHIEQFGAYHALGEISEKTGIVIGVDAVQPEKEPTITFDFPGGTAAELLDMFVAQVPDYRWHEVTDGVIRVSRTGEHVSLLDVTMAFPGADNKTRDEIWEDIAKRPEVSAWMSSARCSRREFFQGKEFKNHNGPISIAPGTRTLAQLLDEVAMRSGENFWAVLQSPPNAPCSLAIILW